MDQFFEYIDRYKFAILGTVLFHVFFFMTTNFVTVKHPYPLGTEEEEITEVEIEADEIELDEQLLEMLNRQNELNNTEVTNRVTDQNDSRERSNRNFSTQELDRQVEEEARRLEQQYMDEWAARHPDSDGVPEQDNSSETSTDDERENNDRSNPNDFNEEGDKSFAGPVMASFNLKNRNVHSLKVPGYTCNGAGVVVIDIKVDRAGDVKSVDFNASLSSGATECMIDKSKAYAKRARFSYSDDAGALQSGTITYRFQGQ